MANSQSLQDQISNAFAVSRHDIAAMSELARLMSERVMDSVAELQRIVLNYNSLFGDFSKLLSDTREAVKKFDSTINNEDTHRVLLAHGWVFPLGVPVADVEHIVNLFSNDPDEADTILCNLFDEHTEHIRDSLIESFPSREPILRDAFDAHIQGKFNLSIPVFLTQADGMWKERCERHLFSGGTDKAIDSLVEDQAVNSLIHTLTLALRYSTFPLFLSENHRPPGFSGLNRHQVLHGESLDYGTRTNSFQAMAFLEYCGMILPDSSHE